MTTLTRSDLIDRSLRQLGILPEGATAQGDQYQRMGEVFDEQYAALQQEGLAYWPSDATPLRVVGALTEFLAAKASPRFVQNPNAGFEAMQAHRKLRAACHRPNISGQEVASEYF